MQSALAARRWTSRSETEWLAAEIERSDGITLKLRIGLNSGEVIVGEIGSGTLGYTAIGEQVGMAQRMESVPSWRGDAERVDCAACRGRVELGEPQMVQIKGSERQWSLRDAAERRPRDGQAATVIELGRSTMGNSGRRSDVWIGQSTATAAVSVWSARLGSGRAASSSRSAAMAASRGVPVFSTFCESHASEIPFQAVADCLRGAFGVDELADDCRRAHICALRSLERAAPRTCSCWRICSGSATSGGAAGDRTRKLADGG